MPSAVCCSPSLSVAGIEGLSQQRCKHKDPSPISSKSSKQRVSQHRQVQNSFESSDFRGILEGGLHTEGPVAVAGIDKSCSRCWWWMLWICHVFHGSELTDGTICRKHNFSEGLHELQLAGQGGLLFCDFLDVSPRRHAFQKASPDQLHCFPSAFKKHLQFRSFGEMKAENHREAFQVYSHYSHSMSQQLSRSKLPGWCRYCLLLSSFAWASPRVRRQSIQSLWWGRPFAETGLRMVMVTDADWERLDKSSDADTKGRCI